MYIFSDLINQEYMASSLRRFISLTILFPNWFMILLYLEESLLMWKGLKFTFIGGCKTAFEVGGDSCECHLYFHFGKHCQRELQLQSLSIRTVWSDMEFCIKVCPFHLNEKWISFFQLPQDYFLRSLFCRKNFDFGHWIFNNLRCNWL